MFLKSNVVKIVVLFLIFSFNSIKSQRLKNNDKGIVNTFMISDTVPLTQRSAFSDSILIIQYNRKLGKFDSLWVKPYLKEGVSQIKLDSTSKMRAKKVPLAKIPVDSSLVKSPVDSTVVDSLAKPLADSISKPVTDTIASDSVSNNGIVKVTADSLNNENDVELTAEEFADLTDEEEFDDEDEFMSDEEDDTEHLINIDSIISVADSTSKDSAVSIIPPNIKWEVSQQGDTSTYWLYNTQKDSTKIWFVNTYVDSSLVYVNRSGLDSTKFTLHRKNKVLSKVWADEKIVSAKRTRRKIINVFSVTQIQEKFKKAKEREYEFGIWNFGAENNIHFSQGYVGYWAKAAESSISNLSSISGYANYKRKKLKFENSAEYKYGFLKPEDKLTRKTNDNFQISSSAGLRASKYWYYQALAGLQTPFFKGYKYDKEDNKTLISNFMSPGYLTLSLGMNYSKSKKLSFLCSPLTSKLTYVIDTTTSIKQKYGVEKGKNLKKEYGAYFKLNSQWKVMKDIIWTNKLDLFSNYMEDPANIDIDWQSKFSFKVNKYIGASISTHLIYDDDTKIPIYKEVTDSSGKESLVVVRNSKKIQFMEVFTIGFTYKFRY